MGENIKLKVKYSMCYISSVPATSRPPAVAVRCGLGKPALIHFAGCIWWQFDSHCENPLNHSGDGCRVGGWSGGETQTGGSALPF